MGVGKRYDELDFGLEVIAILENRISFNSEDAIVSFFSGA